MEKIRHNIGRTFGRIMHVDKENVILMSEFLLVGIDLDLSSKI